ncbi:MAG: 50S ribosomal protein L33 [Lachnospiraceae bacterium]|nr:50S ribosomal protein L33 [Lachnospiraceae bacterium]
MASNRVKITLACTECGDRNYFLTKNKKLHPERMEVKKYCPRLQKYTLHREVK